MDQDARTDLSCELTVLKRVVQYRDTASFALTCAIFSTPGENKDVLRDLAGTGL